MHRRTEVSLRRLHAAGHARLAVALAASGIGLGAWWQLVPTSTPQQAQASDAQGPTQGAQRQASPAKQLAALSTPAEAAAHTDRTRVVAQAPVSADAVAGDVRPTEDADSAAPADPTNGANNSAHNGPTDGPASAAQAQLTPQQWAAAAKMPTPRLPTLHKVAVQAPGDADVGGLNGSAAQPPTPVNTVQRDDGDTSDRTFQAAATTTTSTVYTPAQIRQAYGLGSLPAATTTNKGAYQGSGQLIVIVNAYHNGSAGANLNTFSTRFGLPACTLLANTYKAGATLASMVTAPKAGDGCSFQTVYVSATGAVVGTPPATNASWATEIDLDVQWVHAIAPMAKIVLIEAASASGSAIAAAMQIAAQLGASSVSMSFGATEYAGVTQLDGVMTGKATWVAASGDNGAQVSWPAASPVVLGVGGTQLTTLSPRAELGWSGSGGGLSVYEKMPSFQNSVTIPGNLANTAANAGKLRRGVPDVAYNASPLSGHYVYTNGGWYSIGGTSAGTPQWAALVAVTNAVRTLSGRAAFTGTGFQQGVYGAAAASSYRANYLDITSGSNGTCATCKTLAGYDLATGLGSPNVAALLPTLTALP